MNYPSSLPAPLIKNFEINIPFAVRIVEYNRKPIPQPLVSAKVTFFLSENKLQNWNNFYYIDLENGTQEFIVDWEDFNRVKFVGKPQITTIGNKFYEVTLNIVSLDDYKELATNEAKVPMCEYVTCLEDFLGVYSGL